MESLSQQANQLIDQVNENVSRYADYLKKAQVDKLDKAIKSLKDALIKEVLELPGEDEPYYTEIPPFNPDKILAEMDKLKKTYDSIFDAAFWESVNQGSDNGGNNGNGSGNGNNNGSNNGNSNGSNNGNGGSQNNNGDN